MIAAHLPSGYLLGKTLRADTGILITITMTGAVFSDFDLFWFFFPSIALHYRMYKLKRA